jgi:hypothetical protein
LEELQLVCCCHQIQVKENRVTLKKGAHHVKEFSSHKAEEVTQTFKKNIPDLYEATTSFSLNADDINTLQK